MQKKKTYRLVSIRAPEGPGVGGNGVLELGSRRDGDVQRHERRDRSDEAEAVRVRHEARLSTKKGTVVEWTLVHRYEVDTRGEGCAVSYTVRTVRISELPGPLALFNVPGLRALITSVARSNVRRGFRNLVKLAEGRATAR